MPIKTSLKTILDKKMDRKEFFKHLGLAVVAFSGLSSLIRVLENEQQTPPQATAYGASAYGGTKEKKQG